MDDNDSVSRYEFLREIGRLDTSANRLQDRLDNLAKDSVTATALNHSIAELQHDQAEYEARAREARAEDQAANREQHAALRELIRDAREEMAKGVKEWAARAQATRGERIAIAGIIVTALTALIAAYVTSHH